MHIGKEWLIAKLGYPSFEARHYCVRMDLCTVRFEKGFGSENRVEPLIEIGQRSAERICREAGCAVSVNSEVILERDDSRRHSEGVERESELLQKIGELTVERDFLARGLDRSR